jgi:hypothetical protein
MDRVPIYCIWVRGLSEGDPLSELGRAGTPVGYGRLSSV